MEKYSVPQTSKLPTLQPQEKQSPSLIVQASPVPHKKPVLIFIVLAVITVTGLISLFVYRNYSTNRQSRQLITQQPLSSPSQTSNIIADWKIYSNDDFHFSIKHPPEWERQFYKDIYNDEFGDNWQSGSVIFLASSPESIKQPNTRGIIEGVAFEIIVYKQTDFAVKDLVKLIENKVETDYSVGEVKGTLVEDQTIPGFYRNSNRKILFIEKDSSLLGIELVWSKNKPEAEKTLDQILSSFKFISPIPADTIRTVDINQLRQALELYIAEHGQYPATLNLLNPDYLTAIPTDPITEKSYIYEVSPNKLDYILTAKLKDDSDYTVTAPK